MKKLQKCLSLALVLVMMFSLATLTFAAGGDGFDAMPAGTYTYVDDAPAAVAGSGEGEVQFIWAEKKFVWAFGGDAVKTGSQVLTGDELDFFEGLYLSDLPVTDWLGGNPKDIEGYAGDVAENIKITITENGKISYLKITKPATRALAVLTKDITAPCLTVSGITRGQPNLLQSCITLVGSTNGLYLTRQGDVILDAITIGCDDSGVGLRGDKIGGDTFIVDVVTVNGTVEWHGLKGVITALSSRPGTLCTNGYDIHMTGGSNIGRVGRALTITTGAELGGDIIIGDSVSCDATRGGLLPNADTSTDSLAIATSGDIIAGLGNVVIGTNTEKAVLIDMIGNIQGANVTIKPIDWGKLGNISMWIGNITATGSIDVEIGDVNPGDLRVNISQSSVGEIISTGNTSVEAEIPDDPMGDITALNGDISFKAGEITGCVGNISALNGNVALSIAGVDAIGAVTGAKVVKDVTINGVSCAPTASSVLVDGAATDFEAYFINENNYFKLRDLAYVLSGTAKQFEVTWDEANNAIILTSGAAYTPEGGEMQSGEKADKALRTSSKIVLDGKELSLTAYNIGGNNYFKLRDVGEALDFGVEWSGETNTISIDTAKGYTAE